ncbi:HAD-IB family hydrolase [Puteibacter caeruleilacunae]|nr:HAD-IB family hydrolase [Puteibacter caeruleilacunae]
MTIAFFDFDGTITTKDTFLQFILFAKGYVKTIIGGIVLSPVLFAYKTGLLHNGRAKELVFSFFFKGYSREAINNLGEAFCQNKLPEILRDEMIEAVEKHRKSGDKIVVVSASFSIWIKPWCDARHIDLLTTEAELHNDVITGKLQTKNCFGKEKVFRIKEQYNLEDYDIIYAYGDSKGDDAMLDLADIKKRIK